MPENVPTGTRLGVEETRPADRRTARWTVWKHDCITDGAGLGPPCEPRCDDPWQVDAPDARGGGTFATWTEALEWANKESVKP